MTFSNVILEFVTAIPLRAMCAAVVVVEPVAPGSVSSHRTHSAPPIPQSILLRRMTPEADAALLNFCRGHNYTHFLVRHDRNPELAQPRRGGFLVLLSDAARELAPFFSQGRMLMLQEPLSPYNDLYSCNAILDPDSVESTLEIVGPGFDASDLNRGDISPHEIWNLRCDPEGELSLASAKQNLLVDPDAYKQSVRKRLAKIGKRVTGAFNINRKKKRKEKTQDQLAELAKKYLKRECETLLLEHLDQYVPISADYLFSFAKILRDLRSYQASRNFRWINEIVLSMSLLPSGRIVCWQIVWRDEQSYSAR